MTVDILFVCTGNLHRSPMAEYLLRSRLAELGVTGLTVRSAGTLARTGDPMPPDTLAVLSERRIDGSGFRATYLDQAALGGVDVVIGAAREHRAAAVTLRPGLLNRAFTLHELARISAGIDASELSTSSADDRFGELVHLAASRRTHSLPADPADDDLDDPIGRPYAEFVRCAAAVETLVAAILRPVLDGPFQSVMSD
jgi:low molecular weight protein-tyrosine phosphatase